MTRKQDGKPGQGKGDPSSSQVGTLYSGGGQHAVDTSNRILLVPEWRGAGTPAEFFVILVPDAAHLLVCPPPVFESYLAQQRADPTNAERVPDLERELNARVRKVALDRFGRLALPSEFLAARGIARRAELIGRFNKFEVWPCDQYQAASEGRKAVLPQLTKSLKNL